MAKIQIKNEKISPFGGIYPILDYFDRILGSTIDSALGQRCKWFGYEYREIIRSLMCVCFCGGSCIEDISNHLVSRLSFHPTLRTCSSDTILRAIEELTEVNTTYVSDSGNTNVRFHQQDTLLRIFLRQEAQNLTINRARMDCGSFLEEIIKVVEAHSKQFYIRASRCSSLYGGIKSLEGWKNEEINCQIFELTSIEVEKWGKKYRLVIQRQKRTDGEQEIWEGEYIYRCIITNDFSSSDREIVEYYNLRVGKERVFDEMNNGFGWNHLPKSFMKQNAAFLLLTAFIYDL